MSESVIQVESVGKAYALAHQRPEPERYSALRDVLAQGARKTALGMKNILLTRKMGANSTSEEYWALHDISFDIRQGDRVGIIGRNGAGKSTLLKILSRITEPTKGRIQMRGRVASLLEVGTGFHPELTGRENIFLNGAILGMTRKEVAGKFDEIVDFAEVEKFLDTPVKRYSSGMYVRLAFAVAAHLEPDILIVDEVLAVGDANFQKRCLEKMESTSNTGRTVIFVSHSMAAIEKLCSRIIYLHQGRLVLDSHDVGKSIRQYSNGDVDQSAAFWENSEEKHSSPWFTPISLSIEKATGERVTSPINFNEDIWCHIKGEIQVLDPALTMGIAVYGEDGKCLFWSYQTDVEQTCWPILRIGINHLKVRIPTEILNSGVYRVELIGGLHFRQWLLQPEINAPAVHLSISEVISHSPYWNNRRPHLVAPKLQWHND